MLYVWDMLNTWLLHAEMRQAIYIYNYTIIQGTIITLQKEIFNSKFQLYRIYRICCEKFLVLLFFKIISGMWWQMANTNSQQQINLSPYGFVSTLENSSKLLMALGTFILIERISVLRVLQNMININLINFKFASDEVFLRSSSCKFSSGFDRELAHSLRTKIAGNMLEIH